MTEDEAKQKFCCGQIGGPDLLRLGLCVGSDCMAWRWVFKFTDEYISTVRVSGIEKVPAIKIPKMDIVD